MLLHFSALSYLPVFTTSLLVIQVCLERMVLVSSAIIWYLRFNFSKMEGDMGQSGEAVYIINKPCTPAKRCGKSMCWWKELVFYDLSTEYKHYLGRVEMFFQKLDEFSAGCTRTMAGFSHVRELLCPLGWTTEGEIVPCWRSGKVDSKEALME